MAWLSINFLVRRLGLWWIGWHRPCGCLGNLTDLLHISPRLADNLMKVVLAFLLAGSYWLLWRQWRDRRPGGDADAAGPSQMPPPGAEAKPQ